MITMIRRILLYTAIYNILLLLPSTCFMYRILLVDIHLRLGYWLVTQ